MSRLIDADALKEAINTYRQHIRLVKKRGCKTEDALILDIIGAISKQPTIDAVEVVRGEWEEREVLEDTVINEWQSARCSECGKYHTTPYMYYFDNFNFCPNCGCAMKGADDE